MTTTLDIGEAFTGIAPEVYRLKRSAAVKPADIDPSKFAADMERLVEQWMSLYKTIKSVEKIMYSSNEAMECMMKNRGAIVDFCEMGCDMIILLQRTEDALKLNYEPQQAQLKFGIRMLTLITDSLGSH